jgi:MFS family permease
MCPLKPLGPGTEQKPSGGTGAFRSLKNPVRSLKNPVYRLYFLGMLGQFASMNVQMVTGSLLMYRLTESKALLGTMSLFVAIPMIFVSFFGGAIADRVQKKQILVLGLAASAVVSLAVAIALQTGTLSKENTGSWWILMTSAFLQGTIMGFMMPARQAIIPEIVSREEVMNAVALNTLGLNVLRFLAPGLAGLLIDAYDFKAIYYTMTGLNVWAVIFIFFVPKTGRLATIKSSMIEDIQAGFKYIFSERSVLFILLFTLIIVVFGMPYQQLLPVFTEDILKVGATGMGLLLSVSGIGAMVGSIIVTFLPNRKRGVILLFSGLVAGLALICFSFSTSMGLSMAIMVVIGLAQTGRMTMSNTLLQTYVKGEYMGRVMSVFNIEWGLVSLGTFAAGLMAEALNVQWVIAGFATILVILAILSLLFVTRLKKLE